MTTTELHIMLIQACETGSIEELKHWLEQGADPNLNLKRPLNALDKVIERDNVQMVDLLLDYGAIVKEAVLQKAIEKNKSYLSRLVPNFHECQDESLLMGVLLAAMKISDVALAKQAIEQGAKAHSLFLYAVANLESPEILELVIENGFNIHADKNLILTEFMGSSALGYKWKAAKLPLLEFIAGYYVDKPASIEKFTSLRLSEKLRLFRMGLDSNHINMMKFAFLIGADENEALNSTFYRYYAHKEASSVSNATMFQNHKHGRVDYEIIEFMLATEPRFKEGTISNAVCFNYTELLSALKSDEDLAYAYEMAVKYQKEELCKALVERGVSKEAQHFAQMRVAVIQGDLKALRQAVNEGAKLEALDRATLLKVIQQNQVGSLHYLWESGIVFDKSFNQDLDKAMRFHKAYDAISYLVEIGLDITAIKIMPDEYKKAYPILADMWKRRFQNIFDYTLYLAKEVYPKTEGTDQEQILKNIAELSSLPYVLKRSEQKGSV
jgi:hypothetical protein